MNKYFRQGFAKGAILGCLAGTIISLMLLAHSVAKLQDQVDDLKFEVEHLHQRNEVITQQLQEINRHVGYPGG